MVLRRRAVTPVFCQPMPPMMNFQIRLRLGKKRPGTVLAASVVLLFASVLLIFSDKAIAQSQVDEYRLKAAFLFHFAQFVEWPAKGLPNGEFVFCIAGEDPFQGDLERTVQGKVIGTRPVRVRHLHRPQDGQECQLLFIERNERAREFIASVKDISVLTVGESEDFLRQGGIIRFSMEGRKVRFDVNQETAEKAHLNVSARLLLLARNVIGGKR
jgi:uncharacterized protein DUF4154